MTILSTWTCDRTGPLLGCGIDAQRVERFRSEAAPGGEPWSLIFTDREVSHSRRSTDPALALCASFCAKEAMLKAVAVPIDYRSCELLFLPDREDHEVAMSPEFRDEHGVSSALARVVLNREPRECVVAVSIFGRG